MIRRPPRSTPLYSSAASDVYKRQARRWYPRIYFASPEKTGGHRALADILESIDELRYYRAAMLVPPPGPDSATARQIAAEVLATTCLLYKSDAADE